MRALVILIQCLLLCPLAKADGQAFEQVDEQTAVASLETSRKRAVHYKNATDAWLPSTDDAKVLKELLKSELGEHQLTAIGGPKGYTMENCIVWRGTKIQAFGFIVYGRRVILVDVFPWDPSVEAYSGDRWTREIEFGRVLKGGTAFWWAVYDVDGKCFVDCGHNGN